MSLTKLNKQTLIKKYGRGSNDTGSPEVQIALLTTDINELAEHFKTHPKDTHSRQGLIRKVNLRRSLMKYLQKTNHEAYKKLIADLEIRG